MKTPIKADFSSRDAHCTTRWALRYALPFVRLVPRRDKLDVNPQGSVHGEWANIRGLVLGGIEAALCK